MLRLYIDNGNRGALRPDPLDFGNRLWLPFQDKITHR